MVDVGRLLNKIGWSLHRRMPLDCSGWSRVCGGHFWSRGRTGWVAWTVAAANHRREWERTGEEQQTVICIDSLS